jgi:hypothetical protein
MNAATSRAGARPGMSKATRSTGKRRDPEAQEQPSPRLSDTCLALAALAEPPVIAAGPAGDTASMVASMLHESLMRFQEATSLMTGVRNPQGRGSGLKLSGWTAIAGLAALVLLIGAVSVAVLRQCMGCNDALSEAHYSPVAKDPMEATPHVMASTLQR